MRTIEDLRREIGHEERRAGLQADGHVTDAEIRARRRQISLVAGLVVLGLVVTTLANDVWTSFRRESSVDPELIRALMLVVTVGFVVYLLDKERHLRTLGRLGHQVRELDVSLADRLLRAAALADAVGAVGRCLGLDETLETALTRTADLVGSDRGTVGLLDADGGLAEAAVVTSVDAEGPLVVPDDVVAQVALAREARVLAGSGRPGTVLCAPLVNDGALLGVVTLGAAPGRRFGSDDVAILEQFLERIGQAVSNARRYEAAVVLLDRLAPDVVQSSEELRKAATSIRNAVGALRRDGVDLPLDLHHRSDLLDLVEAEAARIRTIAEQQLRLTA